MTPKEKAEELYNIYYQLVADSSYPEDKAKQCALIAVDEILDDYEEFPYKIQLGKEYWQEVKQELEK